MNMENWGVSIQDFVIEQNQMWFCSSFLNGLFRKDLESEEVFVEYYFNNYPMIGRTLFNKILIADKKIILIPTVAEEIYIYDIEAKEMMSYTLPECVNRAKNRQGFLFGDAFTHKNKLILLPDYAEQIVILDIETRKIETSNLLRDAIEKQVKQKTKHYIEHESILIKNRLYNFFLSYILEYDFETQKLSMNKVLDNGFLIKSICRYKDEICVIDSNHNVYVWNGNTCIKKKEIPYETNRIVQNGNYILGIDMLSGTIVEGEVNAENVTFKTYQSQHENISNVKVINEEIYLSSITSNTITILGLNNRKNRKRKVLINSDKICNMLKINNIGVKDSIIFEQGIMELSMLLSNDLKQVNCNSPKMECGKSIYLKGIN